MTQQHRLITYILIVAVVVAIAWVGTPSKTYTPRGLFLPNGQQFSAISPEKVTLSGNTQAINGTNVGTIHIEAYAPNDGKKIMLASERYAAELAALHGANHVVVTLAGIDPNAKTLTLQATALRT